MALNTDNGLEDDLERLKKLHLDPRVPRYFDATRADKQATKLNEKRKQIDWRYFQILAFAKGCEENLEALNQIERIEDLYKNKADRKVIKQAVKKLNDVIDTKMNLGKEVLDKFAAFRKKLEHELVPWDSDDNPLAYSLKPGNMRGELDENMEQNWFTLYSWLKRLFVEPMNGMMKSGQFEQLGDEILTAPALEKAVWFEASHGSRKKDMVQTVTRELMMEQCKKEEKKTFCSLFSLGKKKAHRDVLDMYDLYDYDEVSAYHVDVQQPQSQALKPFYFPNPNLYQMQPQPLVIADHGYDAGDSLVFATLFGVGLLSLVLCLLVVIVLGAATAFGVGVYVSSKQSSKPCHDDDRNSESSVV